MKHIEVKTNERTGRTEEGVDRGWAEITMCCCCAKRNTGRHQHILSLTNAINDRMKITKKKKTKKIRYARDPATKAQK